MCRKSFILLLFFLTALIGSSFSQQVEQMLKSRPVEISGNVNLTTIFYNARGIPNRYLPFNYVISGTPVLSIYGFQVPVSFIIGKQQSSFTQPFNQFGLSPTYKWLTIHAGYRSLVFSPYTLAGHTFLGAGVELNPGKIRFAAIYGQFNKATLLDTAQQLYFSNFTYKRTGMALRIGYGTENNYFDLIALKAKDDPGSLKIRKGLIDSSGINLTGTQLKSVDIYDVVTNIWNTDQLSVGRASISSASGGNKIVFAGGKIKAFDIYDVLNNTWVTGQLSEEKGGMAAAGAGNKILFGGGESNTAVGISAIVEIFTLSN